MCSKLIIKGPIILQARCYITLWVFMPQIAALQYWARQTAMQDSAVQNCCWIVFIHWCFSSLTKDIYSVRHTKKLTEWPTVYTHLQLPTRKTSRTKHLCAQLTVIDGIGRRQFTILMLVSSRSHRHWGLLSQTDCCLPYIRCQHILNLTAGHSTWRN